MWLWPETQILSFREQKAQAGSQKHGSHTTAPQAQIAQFLKPRTHRLHFFMAPSPCLGEVCPLPRDGRRPALSSAPGTTKVRIPLAKGRVADARRTPAEDEWDGESLCEQTGPTKPRGSSFRVRPLDGLCESPKGQGSAVLGAGGRAWEQELTRQPR